MSEGQYQEQEDPNATQSIHAIPSITLPQTNGQDGLLTRAKTERAIKHVTELMKLPPLDSVPQQRRESPQEE